MENDFAQRMTTKTRAFALKVVVLCRTFEKTDEAFIIKKQLIKSATSVAANYRASNRGRSKAEWFSKLCIVVEESDECEFWLTFVKEAEIKCDKKLLEELIKESDEIMKIMSKTRKTAKLNDTKN